MDLKFRTLRADEVECRVGQVIDSEKFKGATLLLYKTARTDMDLLDETVGAMNWKREHTRDNANCIISIWDSDKKEWVGKEDTGTESNTEAEKGLASDSFKRAGTNWGIGRELYTTPKITVEAPLQTNKKTGRSELAKGISFAVKEMEVDDKTREITKLQISLMKYDKEQGVAFTYAKGVKPTQTSDKTPPKTDDKSKADKVDEKQPTVANKGNSAPKTKTYNKGYKCGCCGKAVDDELGAYSLKKYLFVACSMECKDKQLAKLNKQIPFPMD